VSYERKISTEEAKGKFIFILKNALKKFPQTDKSFKVQVGNKKYSTRIEPKSCTCVATPHVHYHMLVANIPEFSNLKKGNMVTVKKLSDDIYSASVKGRN
jgi:hypothetical protein